jgi:hypothetical protein
MHDVLALMVETVNKVSYSRIAHNGLGNIISSALIDHLFELMHHFLRLAHCSK